MKPSKFWKRREILKKIKKRKYKEFWTDALLNNNFLLLAIDEDNEEVFPDLPHVIRDVPKYLYHDFGISEYVRLKYYKIDYFSAKKIFEQYTSLLEFMRFYQIWRMWFLHNEMVNIYAEQEDDEVLYY